METPLKTCLWRGGVTLAIILLFIGGFYSEENARGLAAWKKAAQDATARGVSLDWNNYIPTPIPDERNFFAAPMMNDWFVRSSHSSSSATLYGLLANPETYTNLITGESASNYLAWCSSLTPQFDQIRDALKRPDARLPGDYSKPFLQPIHNFVSYRNICQVLAHEAKCHLMLGQNDRALADVSLLHKIDMTLACDSKSAVLVTAMIHTAIAGLYTDTISYGIGSHAWGDLPLADLQNQLAEIHLPANLSDSMSVECAGTCHSLELISPSDFSRILGTLSKPTLKSSFSDAGLWFLPQGWYDENRALIVNLEMQMADCIDATNQTISPTRARTSARLTEDAFRKRTPDNFIAALCVPNMSRAAMTVARNQTWVDHTLIACALERYRLANGNYPAALNGLLPQYLKKIPNDIITGTPMKYVRKDDQTFLLYSIGWNESDDGGITVLGRYGNEDRESGDWVWHYPSQ